MFESTVLVKPGEVYLDLTAAIDALPTQARRGGTARESEARLRALANLSRRVDALLLAEIAAFDAQGFASACGARSTGACLSAHTHLDPASTGRMVLAARTADRMPQLGAMLATGAIGVEHLAAVGHATRRIPQDVVTAEDATFAQLARDARPAELRTAGLHLQALYDADAVSKNANHVRDSRHLTLSQTIGDAWHIEGLLTPTDGTSLAVALEALMGKRGDEDDRSITQCRADALIELAELGLRSAELPDCGGDRPRVTLILEASRNPFAHRLDIDADCDDAKDSDTDDPLDDETEGGLDDGRMAHPGEVQVSVTGFNQADAQLLANSGLVPAETLARICCDADLNAATLDAIGQLVNLGRTTRYPNVHQRRALVIRDRHCVFPGCDIPPGRCQAHHLRFWKRHKGRTDLNNLALLCWFHHRLIHEDHWTLEADPPTPEHPQGGWIATAPDGHQLRQHRRPA